MSVHTIKCTETRLTRESEPKRPKENLFKITMYVCRYVAAIKLIDQNQQKKILYVLFYAISNLLCSCIRYYRCSLN